jgi:hypothetical protein
MKDHEDRRVLPVWHRPAKMRADFLMGLRPQG